MKTTFSFKNSQDPRIATFNLVIEAIEQFTQPKDERTVLISLDPGEVSDFYFDEAQVWDGVVGLRLIIKRLCDLFYTGSPDPRIVETKFHELYSEYKNSLDSKPKLADN